LNGCVIGMKDYVLWDNSDPDCPDLRCNPKNCRLCETGQRGVEESN